MVTEGKAYAILQVFEDKELRNMYGRRVKQVRILGF
jgi:hypothetical protein